MFTHRKLPSVTGNFGRADGVESSKTNVAQKSLAKERQDAALAASRAAFDAEQRARKTASPPSDGATLKTQTTNVQRPVSAREQMAASLAASSAAFHAEKRAKLEAMPPPDWTAFEAQAERAQRAKDAQRTGQKAKNPRSSRPAPEPTPYYAQPISTDPACDERLSGTAVRLLLVLRSRLATEASTMKAALAAALKVSERTIQRAMFLLEEAGYIERTEIRTAKGWQIGQTIRLLAAALPPFLRRKGGNQGETFPSPYNGKLKTSISLEQKIRQMVYAVVKPQPYFDPG